MSYIITYYLPSGLFVVVSWISFLIPPEIVPGMLLEVVLSFWKNLSHVTKNAHDSCFNVQVEWPC